jgi:bifunctional ADP-heptose synthase (sugar kinase/adenylyltransferase)
MRVEDAHCHPLDSAAEEDALAWIKLIEPQLDAVIFCDFGYGTITSGLLAGVHQILNGRRRVITADVSGQRSRLLQFKNVDMLCPTERELRSALHDFDRGLSSVAWDTLHSTQAKQLLVTLGKKGLVVFDRQTSDKTSTEWKGRLRSEYLPSLAEQIVDPLGCGDALLSVTTLGLAAGGTLMQSAYLGSAAAAIEIARIGNQPLDHYTLKRWMSGRIELAETQQAVPMTAQLIQT